MIKDQKSAFWPFILSRRTMARSAKVGAIVGTILVLINHAPTLLEGEMPALWQIILTYMVPYSVSSYSTAALLRDLKRESSEEQDTKSTIVPPVA